ncbi:MAG: hypothetical protein ACE5KI_00735, partial [Dehalococcoidia bacterium]
MTEPKVISADSHADEPASLFDQLPEEYREKRPRIETINGVRCIVSDGTPPFGWVDPPNPVKEADKRGSGGIISRTEDMGQGDERDLGLDIPHRVAEIEADGVKAEVVYPNGSLGVGASPDAGYQ